LRINKDCIFLCITFMYASRCEKNQNQNQNI
jgi:hypothetical protein